MKNVKIDFVTLAGVLGTVMGVAATLISGWSQDKAMKDEVQKAVAEAIADLKK